MTKTYKNDDSLRRYYATRHIPRYRLSRLITGIKQRRHLYSYPGLLQDLLDGDTSHCACCGCLLNYIGLGVRGDTPSLDRVNNDLGYIKGNVKLVCRRCNQTKSNRGPNELRRMYDYAASGEPDLEYLWAGAI